MFVEEPTTVASLRLASSSRNISVDELRRSLVVGRNGPFRHAARMELEQWAQAVVSKRAFGLGQQYPSSSARSWKPARNVRLDYMWRPISKQTTWSPNWTEQLSRLPTPSPPAGVIYMQIGAWPPWIQFLLASAAANRLVYFYFVGAEPLPSDHACVRCIWLPLNATGFEERLRVHLGIELAFGPGYRAYLTRRGQTSGLEGAKLNDFKPAVGALFPELASKHKWIGYSDPDVILGNLSHEVSLLRDDSDLLVPLERFPEPLANGNFMLLRCTPRILNAFRRTPWWRDVFAYPRPMAFDEWHYQGELKHRQGGAKDTRYPSSIYTTFHTMMLNGDLRPQPATRFLLQDAIITTYSAKGMYYLIDSLNAKVNMSWDNGVLIAARRGPCICPDDVIPQPGIASCPACVKVRGDMPKEQPIEFRRGAHPIAAKSSEAPRFIQLDRTVELLGFHFQMWKKRWRSREYRLIRAFNGTRPPFDVIPSAVPECLPDQLKRGFFLDGAGFRCL